MDSVIQVPSWAYDFCFYYLALAAVVVVASLYSIFQLFLLPTSARKQLPVIWLIISTILSGTVTVVLTMMQFWICRSALAPKEGFWNAPLTYFTQEDEKDDSVTEKFALQCSSPSECQKLTGDNSSVCTCSGMGTCAGCLEKNTQGSGEYPGFADWTEAFSTQSLSKRGH